MVLFALSSGCTTDGVYQQMEEGGAFVRQGEIPREEVFQSKDQATYFRYAEEEQVESFSESADSTYRFGPGDEFAFLLAYRPEISRERNIVSPDGLVSIPRAGIVPIAGLTLEEATTELERRLSEHFEEPDVTLSLTHIHNNRVFVLGRVANPGSVDLTGATTLLEALSLAGGLPADTQKSFLTRCMIVRGKDMVIWIDLKELLENGNMALNPELQRGDFIFIPQSEDQLAYVMGQVRNPGVLLLRSQMTVVDAIMQAGGPTLGAKTSQIILVRMVDGVGYVENIDFTEMFRKGDLRQNYVLKAGDIVYVGPDKLQQINNVFAQLLPSMQVIDFSLNTMESFGVMQELRNRIWGQEGTVGRGASSVSE